MNNTLINIEGIKVNQQVVRLEHSTDVAWLLSIKDEQGNEVRIRIINNIIEGWNGTYSNCKHEQ
jgi:hypothetical protein